jgi:hypothetical protein
MTCVDESISSKLMCLLVSSDVDGFRMDLSEVNASEVNALIN